MCGIVGFNFKDEMLVRAMMRAQSLRGPDQEGSFTDDAVSIGHNRLSIIDLSENGHQPMWNASKDVALIFNGEIYNFQTIKKELEKKYVFVSKTDSEVILHGYEEYRDKIFGKLEGMFALALYDTRAKKLILARDSVGIKPLLYYQGEGKEKGKFFFAQTMAAFCAAKLPLTLRTELLPAFLSYGFVPSPHSIYREVSKVLPGEIISLNLETSAIEKKRTLLKPANPLAGLGKEATETKVHGLLSKSVAKHMMSDVGVGLFLSGGVDSSLIAALLSEQGVNIPAFCLKMEGRSDSGYAAKIADKLGWKLHTLEATRKDIEEVYDEIFAELKEPLADTAIFSAYLVSKLAKGKAKVVLSGEGGDELFGGYVTHARVRNLSSPRFLDKSVVDSLALRLPSFKGKKTLLDALYSAKQDALGLYLNNLATAHLYSYGGDRKYFEKLRDCAPFFYDLNSYLPDRLLYKLDAATMHYSLEGRVPFLDKEVVEFAMSKESQDFFAAHGGKKVLKDILAKSFPREWFERPKEGFSVPLVFFMETQKFRDDHTRALAWLRGIDAALAKRVERARGKTAFNLVALYKAVA